MFHARASGTASPLGWLLGRQISEPLCLHVKDQQSGRRRFSRMPPHWQDSEAPAQYHVDIRHGFQKHVKCRDAIRRDMVWEVMFSSSTALLKHGGINYVIHSEHRLPLWYREPKAETESHNHHSRHNPNQP